VTLKNDFKTINSNLRSIYDIIEKRPEFEKHIKKDIAKINNSTCTALKTLKAHLNDDDIKSIQPGLFEGGCI